MEPATHTAFLLLGGNLGNRADMLAAARTAIEESAGIILNASPLFETAAWGVKEQPSFLNQALEIRTALSPQALLESLLATERALGRERRERYGPRSIDIDILFYDELILDEPKLQIPHPQLQNRRFVLTPLAAVAPGLRHPVSGATVTEMLAACADTLPVYKFPGV